MSALLLLGVSNRLTISIRVRAKIRDGVDGHYAFDDYWIRCLYEDENGDPDDVEKGFLKSKLLVKVQRPAVLSCVRVAHRLSNRLFR